MAAPKRILFWGPGYTGFERTVRSLAADREVTVADAGLRFAHERADLLFTPAFTVDAVYEALQQQYLHLLVLDLRCPPGAAALEERLESTRRLLAALDAENDLEARYGFHRILVLVGGPDSERIDRLLIELGGYGIRHALQDRCEPDADCAFGQSVLEAALRLILDRRPSRTALCAAGGGITGIFFELGAIKCLEDCFSEGAIHDFDMFFGISAGAVVTSVIANGFSSDEMMAALAGVEGGRIPPLDLSLLRLGHLNVPDYLRRAGVLAGKTARGALALLRGDTRPSLDGAFLELTSLVGAPFRSDRFEAMMREIFRSTGASNEFDALHPELYIGASNQDARRHRLFGPGDTVPISLAVQASLSINPAFSAVEIEGEFYEDGAVTRTSNFIEAIERDASLVLVLDPFVPFVSKEPGFANRRGMLFNIDQDVRSLSYTRYENARQWAMRRYPEVSSYTFLPNNRLRERLSINPMDHRPYMEIFRGAYLGTLGRLKQVQHRLSGDLAVHGIELDTSAGDAIAERLRSSHEPQFEDFFVDGRVRIRTPTLTHQRSSEGKPGRSQTQ